MKGQLPSSSHCENQPNMVAVCAFRSIMLTGNIWSGVGDRTSQVSMDANQAEAWEIFKRDSNPRSGRANSRPGINASNLDPDCRACRSSEHAADGKGVLKDSGG